MATPQALDVPTARTGATPSQTSKGTVRLPPPMPTTADSAPMPPFQRTVSHQNEVRRRIGWRRAGRGVPKAS
jgi:hypothetical protein